MYRWTYELYSLALLVKLATTFPCLMLLAKLPTIEARYSRTTPPRLDCVRCTSGIRSTVAFLRPTSVATLFSTTVENKRNHDQMETSRHIGATAGHSHPPHRGLKPLPRSVYRQGAFL